MINVNILKTKIIRNTFTYFVPRYKHGPSRL